MKTWNILPHFQAMVLATATATAAALAGCGADDGAASSINQQLTAQNQKLDEQDKKITQMSQQLEMIQETLDQKMHAAPALAPPAPDNSLMAVDLESAARKEAIRQLVGFNGRLSAGLGFPVYTKALGDLNSELAQQLLEIKNQGFVEQAKLVLKDYNLASDLWDKLSRSETEFVSLSPTERYSYSQCGINFADGYHVKLSDLPQFWRAASDQTQRLIDLDKEFTQEEVSARN